MAEAASKPDSDGQLANTEIVRRARAWVDAVNQVSIVARRAHQLNDNVSRNAPPRADTNSLNRTIRLLRVAQNAAMGALGVCTVIGLVTYLNVVSGAVPTAEVVATALGTSGVGTALWCIGDGHLAKLSERALKKRAALLSENLDERSAYLDDVLDRTAEINTQWRAVSRTATELGHQFNTELFKRPESEAVASITARVLGNGGSILNTAQQLVRAADQEVRQLRQLSSTSLMATDMSLGIR